MRASSIVLSGLLAALSGTALAGPTSAPPPPDGAGTGAHRPGPADTRRIVGVLDVRVEGVSDDIKRSFQTSLEQQLDTKHYWLAGLVRVHQALANSTKWTEGCVVGPCLAEMKTQTGAEVALLAALTGSGTSFGFVVTLVRTDNGKVLAQESDRCEVCTVSEATTKATLATIGLLNGLPDALPDETEQQGAAVTAAVAPVQAKLARTERHQTRVGIALTVVGLAAAAAGVAIYVVKDHVDYGLATAVGGGAMALGGITVLAF